jgi:arginase family enzyme
MQLTDYLSPIDSTVFDDITESSARTLVNVADIYLQKLPELEHTDLVIIGVEESRNGSYLSVSTSADNIRRQFYKLAKPKYEIRLADLGNIKAGNTLNDTLFAVNAVVKHLLEMKKCVIILGGTQDLAYAQYTAYQGINRSMNVFCCDACIQLKQNDTQPEHNNYLLKLIAHQPNYLFNITHAGSQQYFIEQESIDTFEKMNFDLYRLGALRSRIQEAEPLLRNSDMMVMSANSIKAADAPGSIDGNPNGLNGDEACQITRYAGMSNELSSIGIYDYAPEKDLDNRTAKLLSQALWYFVDGYYNRKNDYPAAESRDYTRYLVTTQNASYDIVFYKNNFTDRWWMEIPYPNEKSKHSGKYMVPCSYSDYEAALKDEIPDRWLKAYHKLM